MRQLLFGLIAGALLLFPFNGLTQDLEVPTPAAAPPLPEFSDGPNAGLLINASNVAEFRSIIIPELYPLMRARLIEMDAVARPRFNLPEMSSATEGGQDTTDEAEILEQAQQLWARSKLFIAGLTLSFVEDGKLSKQLQAEWLRVYPKVLNPSDKSIQFYREIFSLVYPEFLKGLKFLTFRFKGEDEEDMLWLSSAATHKVRQLTGANLSDPILDSVLSLEDLLGWSGKAELVEARINKRLTALVPFSAKESRQLSAGPQNCLTYKRASEDSALRLNFETHRFADTFAWLPSDIIFAPRQLVRLELVPKDPFSLYGRQILYIDQESGIVHYKFIFDRSGYLWKSIYNVPQLLTEKESSSSILFSEYILIEDRKNKNANVLTFDRLSFCSTYTKEASLAMFDPSELIAVPTATPGPAKKKK